MNKKLIAAILFSIIAMTPVAHAKDEAETAAFIQLMSEYLDVSRKVVELANSPQGAAYLAVEGIYEIYEQQRDAPSAIAHYQRLLEESRGNQAIRNLIRFKLRDIYRETSQPKKALEQLDLVLAENLES